MDAEIANRILTAAQSSGIKNAEINVMKRNQVTFENIKEPAPMKRLTGNGCPAFEQAFHASLADIPEAGGIGIELDNGPAAGDDCPAMTLFSLEKEEFLQTFETSDDTVYLLDFWATWCGPCQGPMAHNEKMLNANPGWEGKAKILAISLDDDVEAPKNRITEREWIKVGSVWGGEGGFGCKPSQDYAIQGIPTCLLAHKGKILWRGHPSERKLDEDINGLIEGREVSFGGAANDSAESTGSASMSAEEVTEKLNQVKEILASFKEENDKCLPLELYCIQEQTYRLNTPESAKTNCFLVGHNLSPFKPACEAVAEKIRSIFPSVSERIQYRDPNPAISRATQCFLCNKTFIDTDTMFIDLYSTGDEVQAHCEECENKTLEGTGSATMANFHHCYKVTAKSKNLDLLPWGPNEYPKNDPQDVPV